MADTPSTDPQRPLWQNPRIVSASIGALIFVIFAAQNSGTTSVDFLFWGFQMSLILLMMFCAAIGAAIWELVKYLRRRSIR